MEVVDTIRPPPPALSQLVPYPLEWALFLDFDGTLLNLAAHPEDIEVPSELPSLLHSLYKLFEGAIAVFTGRSLGNLDRHLGCSWCPASGQHGAEWRFHQGMPSSLEESTALASARHLFKAFASQHAGTYLEDKGLSLALHFRGMPELVRELRQLADRTVTAGDEQLEILRGKSVLEVRLRSVNKGSAVRRFLTEIPFKGRKPLMVGDDRTDEDAFEEVLTVGGTAVKVGEGPTVAPWRLKDPDEVRVWLSEAAGNTP